MIFLDTSYLFALNVPDDSNHKRAVEIAGGINEETRISEQVFSELITLMAVRGNGGIALEVGKKILSSDIAVVNTVRGDLKEALEIVGKYEGLSFCDATSVCIMRKFGVSKIASFDSDFDKIKEIKRIY